MTNTTVTTRNLLDSMHQAANEEAIDALVNNYGFNHETAIKLVTEFDGYDFELTSEASF
jgi:hypothetical protein